MSCPDDSRGPQLRAADGCLSVLRVGSRGGGPVRGGAVLLPPREDGDEEDDEADDGGGATGKERWRMRPVMRFLIEGMLLGTSEEMSVHL